MFEFNEIIEAETIPLSGVKRLQSFTIPSEDNRHTYVLLDTSVRTLQFGTDFLPVLDERGRFAAFCPDTMVIPGDTVKGVKF